MMKKTFFYIIIFYLKTVDCIDQNFTCFLFFPFPYLKLANWEHEKSDTSWKFFRKYFFALKNGLSKETFIKFSLKKLVS